MMYDALIIVNGEIPRHKHWQDIHYRTLICTDGAARFLRNLELTPDIIIGDMDSISEATSIATYQSLEMQFPECKIHRIEDQETTDFEKALSYARQAKMKSVFCLGVFGKSADHSINNFCLVSRFSKNMRFMLLHVFNNSRQWIFPLSHETRILTQKKAILSLLPFPKARLSTQGLKWELTNTTLSLTDKTSVRNTTSQKAINIQCEGKCICILTTDAYPTVTYRK